MHLGNGALTPECAVVALGVAATGMGISLVSARLLKLPSVRARTAATVGAAVFAAQMFNLPVLPFSSAHLIGGTLLAWILGPAVGFLTMCGLLALQAIALGDGGLLALGANAINMALVPAIAVAVLNRWRSQPLTARVACLLAMVAFLSTVVGSLLLVAEVAIGRDAAELVGFRTFAYQMIGSHLAAGLLEGAATVALVAVLARLSQPGQWGWKFSPACSAALIASSLAVALLSTPALGLASPMPDGYEAAVAASGAVLEDAVLDRSASAENSSALSAQVQGWQDAAVSALSGPPALVVMWTTILAGAWAAACALCAGRAAASRIA